MRVSPSVIVTVVFFFLFGLGASDYLLIERGRLKGRRQPLLQHTATNLDLLTIARNVGFDFLPVSGSEQSFLQRLLPDGRKHILRSAVLLKGGERVAAVYFYRSPDISAHLETVKAWMYELFSRAMINLVDDTLTRENLAPIAVLAFTDSSMSEERFLFAKIRDHLYEFHFPEEHEGLVHGLLQELARDSL